jgi:hypothetical protein
MSAESELLLQALAEVALAAKKLVAHSGGYPTPAQYEAVRDADLVDLETALEVAGYGMTDAELESTFLWGGSK